MELRVANIVFVLLSAFFALVLPCNASQPELVAQAGHSQPIRHVGFSPDGKLIATASEDRTVRLWDSRSGSLLRIFAGHSNSPEFSFSSDSTKLVTSNPKDSGTGQCELFVWNVSTGKLLWQMNTEYGMFYSLSPDSRKLLVGSENNETHIYDLLSGERLGEVKASGVEAVFSGDGLFLAIKVINSEEKERLVVWDLGANQESARLDHYRDIVDLRPVNEKGAIAIYHDNGTSVTVFDIYKNGKLGEVKGTTPVVSSCTGKYVITKDVSGKFFQCSLLTFQETELPVEFLERGEIAQFFDNVFSVHTSVKGTLISSLRGNNILMNLKNLESTLCPILSRDGTRLILCMDRGFSVWNVPQKELAFKVDSQPRMLCVAFDESGKQLANGSDDKLVRVFDFSEGGKQIVLQGHTDAVNCVAYHPTLPNMLISGGSDARVFVWNTITRDRIQALSEDSPVRCLSLNGTGEFLAVGTDNSVTLRNFVTGNIFYRFKSTTPVRSITFSPDGKFLLWSDDYCHVMMYQLGNSDGWPKQTVIDGQIVSSSKGGNFVAYSGCDEHISGWLGTMSPVDEGLANPDEDIRFKRHYKNFTNVPRTPRAIAIANSGKLIAVSGFREGDKLLAIGSLLSKNLTYLKGHSAGVNSIAFNPGGNLLASSSDDGTIRFWSTDERREVVKIAVVGGTSDWVAIAPDGRFDSSEGAMKSIHYVENNRIVESDQLKEDLYEPGILAKLTGFSRVPLRRSGASRLDSTYDTDRDFRGDLRH